MSGTADDIQASTTNLDYDFWASMPGWRLFEAAALLLDLDPDKISKGSPSDAEPGSGEWQYHRLLRRLMRARTMKEIRSPKEPWEFLDWAISNKLSVSDALKESVTRQHGKRLTDWQKKFKKLESEHDRLSSQVSEEIHPKERNSFLKLVLGMARAKFKHTKERSAVKTIAGTLEVEGLKVDDDVIRRLLTEAQDKFDGVI